MTVKADISTSPVAARLGGRLLALGLLLFLVIAAGGLTYFKHAQAGARRVAQETLLAVADLKVGQIAGWMKERRSDVETFFDKPQARQFLTEPDNAAVREELLQWMTTFQRIYDYSTVALFDARAAVRLSAPADAPLRHTCIAAHVQAALRAREVVVTDLHRGQSNEPIHLSLLVPVGVKPQAGQPADGVLLFVIEPHRFLYPLVQSWPTPSRTAETLLVHRESDEVVYLNELRHRTNAALTLRLPVNRPNYPAALAVQGREGVVEGTDYRDMPVLAATRKIPGTPWFMVAKVDQEEIYAQIRQKAWTVAVIIGLLLLAALLGIALLWRQQKLESARRELAERTRVDAVLRESEQLLQRAQEIAHLGCWQLDLVHNRLSWSDEVYRIFGLKPQEFGATYEAFLERVHPDDRQKVDAAYGGSLRENRDTYEIEHRVIRKDTGALRVVHEQCEHFRDATGKITRSIGTVHDITEQRQAEQALLESEQRLRAIVDESPFGAHVYELQADGRLVLIAANESSKEVLGVDVRDRVGKTIEEAFPALTTTDIPAAYRRVAATGWAFSREDVDYDEHGIRGCFEIHAFQIGVNRMAVQFRDVTERKKAEEAVRNLNAELDQRVRDRTADLETANKELEAFSYSVSHDLRAPLRAVDGFANILLEDYAKQLDAEGQRVIGVMRAEVQRMGQLIDDLLAFSRLGRQPMQLTEVDLNALAQAEYERCAAQAPCRRIEFKLHPLPSVRGDAAMLRRVLANLLSNAVKFTRPREVAVIEIGVMESPGDEVMRTAQDAAVPRSEHSSIPQLHHSIVFFIRDNGVGFDMKYVGKLFGVFQRLHTLDEFEGTGVGLALVQRIIHRHGGRVWAEGKVNGGATFCFTMPCEGMKKAE